MSTAVAANSPKVPAVVKKKNELREFLERGKSQFEQAMQKHMDPDRLIRLVLTAATRNAKILDCSRESVALALLTASQLGLEPNGRDAHIVPYGREAQLIPDFKGLIKLAYDNPRVSSFQASSVRENDFFNYEHGTEAFIRHKPTVGERGELIYAYAICKLKGAEPSFVVLSRDDVEKRRMVSQTGRKNIGPWRDWPDEMWAKTAVKVLSKFVPLGGAFEAAVEHDNASDGIVLDSPLPEPQAVRAEAEVIEGDVSVSNLSNPQLAEPHEDKPPEDEFPFDTGERPTIQSEAATAVAANIERARSRAELKGLMENQMKTRAAEMVEGEQAALFAMVAQRMAEVE